MQMVIKHLFGDLCGNSSCLAVGVEALRSYYPLETTPAARHHGNLSSLVVQIFQAHEIIL